VFNIYIRYLFLVPHAMTW